MTLSTHRIIRSRCKGPRTARPERYGLAAPLTQTGDLTPALPATGAHSRAKSSRARRVRGLPAPAFAWQLNAARLPVVQAGVGTRSGSSGEGSGPLRRWLRRARRRAAGARA